MPEPFRVLVTASRDWSRSDLIRATFRQVEREHPGCQFVLVHGQCDPRHPRTGHAIRWAVATRLTPEQQRQLTGGDWLCHLVAADLGWDTEPHPADWQQHRRSAGFRRNEHMVRLGASICLAFSMPCTAPRCAGRPAHGSHGTAHCADLAEKAGIQVRRFAPAT